MKKLLKRFLEDFFYSKAVFFINFQKIFGEISEDTSEGIITNLLEGILEEDPDSSPRGVAAEIIGEIPEEIF